MTSSIISFVAPPGLKIIGGTVVISITVDSSPTPVCPPSKISGMSPLRSSSTCFASVGLGFPLRFALGAASGPPNSRRSS